MIILLSPAKTLDYERPTINISHSVPSLLSKSKTLINSLKEKKQDVSPVQQGVLDEDGNLIEIEN